MIKPNLALFVNGIPVVVMEARSPSLMDVWKSQAVRQLCRYQEAGPEWHGTGAPRCSTTTCCVSPTAGPARPTPPRAHRRTPTSKRLLLLEVRGAVLRKRGAGALRRGAARAGAAHRGNAGPETLLDILRDNAVYGRDHRRTVKKLPRYQQYRAATAATRRILSDEKPEERGGVIWHTQGTGKSLTMLWLATKIRWEPRLANADIVVVTDRTQLDKQISDTFQRCGLPAPERMDRTRPKPEERRARRRRERPDRAAPLDLQTASSKAADAP